MSGILGIIHFDQRPVTSSVLEHALQGIAHRGPDRISTWTGDGGSVAFSHLLLQTTPESAFEAQPLISESGRYVLVADARIDNRLELASQLDLGRPVREAPDSQFILAAFEKWGRDCPVHLVGDFAFAVWDCHDRQLFCARDVGGVRPFYYAARPGLFMFASGIDPVLRHPDVPPAIDKQRVAEFIADMDLFKRDKEGTCYKAIKRLPMNQSLVANASGVQTWVSWEPDLDSELERSSDEEYARHFREVFSQAVQARMRSTTPLGSMLSGGLDSSSITCMADTLNESTSCIHTFSATYPDLPDDRLDRIDERSYIGAVNQNGNFCAHVIRGDRLSPFMDFQRVVGSDRQPFCNPNNFIIWSGLKECRKRGIRVLFHGSDGDTVVSHGTDYLVRLIETGQWDDFARATGADKPSADQPLDPWQTFNVLGGANYLLDLPREEGVPAGIKEIRRAGNALDLSFPELILGRGASWAGLLRHAVQQVGHRVLKNGENLGADMPLNVLTPALRDYVEGQLADSEASGGISGSDDASRSDNASMRADHWADIHRGAWQYGFEMYDAFAAQNQIEMRYPFFDRRLIETSLAMPGSLKVRGGWGRYIMRIAMKGILPPKIQWRVGKASLTPGFDRGMRTKGKARIQQTVERASGTLSEYISPEKVQMVFESAVDNASEPSNAVQLLIYRLVMLDGWLRHSEEAL